MTFSNINVSNPNDGLGDKLRDAFIIVNDNFSSIGTIVDATYITATLSNYATKTYVDNIEADLQDQIDFINGRLNTNQSDINSLETNVDNLTLALNSKASLTQLNNSIANVNDAIAAQQNDINSKIDDAPNDGFIYGRQNGAWVISSGGGGGTSSIPSLNDVTGVGATTSNNITIYGGEDDGIITLLKNDETAYVGVEFAGNQLGLSAKDSCVSFGTINVKRLRGAESLSGIQTYNLPEKATGSYTLAVAEDGDYSTTEKATGAKWIDGSPIYRKVFSGIITGAELTILHNIDGLNTLINKIATFNQDGIIISDGYKYDWDSSGQDHAIELYVLDSIIFVINKIVGSGASAGTKTYNIILEYTKN